MSYLCDKNTDPGCISVCSTQYNLSAIDETCLMCNDTLYADFSSAWTSGQCRNILSEAYWNIGFSVAQRRANRVMEYMMGPDGSLFAVNGRNDLQNSLLELCGGSNSNSPDACSNYLQYILLNNYTYDEMGYNLGIANWLGCFISPPTDELDTYNSLAGSVSPSTCAATVGGFPCYPMCHRVDTVQRYDSSQKPCNCDTNVCVIDQVAINASNSSGSVSITQFCHSCTQTRPCTCIISAVDIEDDSTLDYSVNQYCGANSTCYNIDGGVLINVDCQDLGSNPNSRAFSVAIPVFIIIVGILFFMIIAGYLFTKSNKDRDIIASKKKQSTLSGSPKEKSQTKSPISG